MSNSCITTIKAAFMKVNLGETDVCDRKLEETYSVDHYSHHQSIRTEVVVSPDMNVRFNCTTN